MTKLLFYCGSTMTQVVETIEQVSASHQSIFAPHLTPPKARQTKHGLGQKIDTALQSAKDLPPQACLVHIRTRLLAIQACCTTIGKVFIVVEERIACHQYDLGGSEHHCATLFRGPSEDASVAICVTDRGSLLYRNSSPWQVYRNVGDVQYSPNIPFTDA